MTQQERLQRAEEARGALVKIWVEKAKCQGSGKDFRGVVCNDCLIGVGDLMKAGEFKFGRANRIETGNVDEKEFV